MASPLADFIDIGPRCSLYTPESAANGQLVIICTWLGAGRKPIAKYTSLYQRIAPGARILLVQSDVPILISSYAHQRQAIQPAVSVILDTLSECSHQLVSPDKADEDLLQVNEQNKAYTTYSTSTTSEQQPKILLQMFSNGGTNTATQMMIILRRRLQAPLPLAGLICDSCPAKGTYWKSHDAMVLSLPKDAASRMLGALACHCILILLYTWIACGNENPASLQRRILLDANTSEPGWESLTTDATDGTGRICYLYSDSDRMCQWSDVNEHAEEARKNGWQVEEVMFEGSKHCAHLSRDEPRYVQALEDIWNGTGVSWVQKRLAKL